MHNSRRLRIVMLAGLMLSLVLSFAPGSPAAQPALAQGGTPSLVNPSFEDGVVGWSTQPTCNYTTYGGTTQFPAQQGTIYMGANRNNSATCTSVYQDLVFEPTVAVPYRFAIWIRSSTATNRSGTLVIRALGGTAESRTASFTAKSGLWQCAEVAITPTSAHTSMRVEMTMSTLVATEDYQFDNAFFLQRTATICPQVGEGSTRLGMFTTSFNRNGGAAALGMPTETARMTGVTGSLARSQQLDRGSVLYHDELRDSPFQSIPAYVLHEPFLSGFRSLTWLGAAPTSDRFTNEAGQLQVNFPNGFIYRDGAQTLASSWPISTTGQWYAEYHNGSNFNGGATWVQNVPGQNLDNLWLEGAPGAGKWGVWADNFVVRWTGRFNFTEGYYRFVGAADDSLRVWIDNELVLVSNLQEAATVRWMSAGQHTIRVQMVEIGGGANMYFEWAAAPGCNLVINNGQAFVNQRTVSLRAGATGAAEQLLSNDPAFPGALWQPFQTTTPWTLADNGGQVGGLSVYGRYRAAGGASVCEPGPGDAITYDPLPPSLSAYSNSPVVTSVIYSTAADQANGSGLSEMQVSQLPDFSDATWQPYDPQLTVPAGLFTTWYVRVRDYAGNVSRTVVTGFKSRLFLPLVRR